MGQIQRSQLLQDVTTSSPLTFAAPGAGKYNCVDAIAVDSDSAATVTIESPAGTVLFRVKIQASTGFEKTWNPDNPIRGTVNSALIVKCDTGSTININASGFVTP